MEVCLTGFVWKTPPAPPHEEENYQDPNICEEILIDKLLESTAKDGRTNFMTPSIVNSIQMPQNLPLENKGTWYLLPSGLRPQLKMLREKISLTILFSELFSIIQNSQLLRKLSPGQKQIKLVNLQRNLHFSQKSKPMGKMACIWVYFCGVCV